MGDRRPARRRPRRTCRRRTGACRAARPRCRAAGQGGPARARGSAYPPHGPGTPASARCTPARSWPAPSGPRCSRPAGARCPGARRRRWWPACDRRRAGPAAPSARSSPAWGAPRRRGGLSTTRMSASSYTTRRPGTGSGLGWAVTGGGSVTSSQSPAATRADLAAAAPPTRTAPVAISSAALALDRPNMRARAASRRSPSSPSGTGTWRWPSCVTCCRRPPDYRPVRCPRRDCPAGRACVARSCGAARHAGSTLRQRPVDLQPARGQQHGQDPAADDRRIGDVEHWPVRQLDPVDHVTAQWPGRPQQPVDQVAGGAAEQQAERDGPRRAANPARCAQDEDDHAERDGREHDRHGGADTERGARIAVHPQRQQPAEQPDRRPGGQRGDDDHLRDDVRGQYRDGDGKQHPHPALRWRGAARSAGQRRSSRCLHATHRVARGNACNRAFPIGSPQDSQVP